MNVTNSCNAEFMDMRNALKNYHHYTEKEIIISMRNNHHWIWSHISFGCKTAWGRAWKAAFYAQWWIWTGNPEIGSVLAWLHCRMKFFFLSTQLKQFYHFVLVFCVQVEVVRLLSTCWLSTCCINIRAEKFVAFRSRIVSPPTCCPVLVSLAEWSNYQQQPLHSGLWSWL